LVFHSRFPLSRRNNGLQRSELGPYGMGNWKAALNLDGLNASPLHRPLSNQQNPQYSCGFGRLFLRIGHGLEIGPDHWFDESAGHDSTSTILDRNI